MAQYSKATRERLKVAQKYKESKTNSFRLITKEQSDRYVFWPSWMTRAYQNNRYTVMVQDDCKTTSGPAIRAMIQAHDDRPITYHWSEIQKIKNQIFGEETWAVEYYPAESELRDDYNIYISIPHWCD